jgi:hypothetical protein
MLTLSFVGFGFLHRNLIANPISPRFPVLMAILRAEVHVPEPGNCNATAGVHYAVRWRDGMAACGVGPRQHLAGVSP